MTSAQARGQSRSTHILLAAATLLLGVSLLLPNGAMAQLDILKNIEKGAGSLGGVGSSGGSGGSAAASLLSSDEIADGLREALRVGTERVVDQVGTTDGFNLDPDIHIPLPGPLQDAQRLLNTIGMSDMADDLELRLNRAAEAAAPEAQQLFVDAISEMSLEDAQRIYDGPDDAATRYFQEKMSPALAERMAPIVDEALAEVGAIQSFDAMMSQYQSLPLAPDVKADLTDYTVEQAMDGIFHYVAKEEAAIRQNPAARTTELLQKVFGAS